MSNVSWNLLYLPLIEGIMKLSQIPAVL